MCSCQSPSILPPAFYKVFDIFFKIQAEHKELALNLKIQFVKFIHTSQFSSRIWAFRAMSIVRKTGIITKAAGRAIRDITNINAFSTIMQMSPF